MDNGRNAVGESFHVVSPAALTLRGYAELMAAWFGQPAHQRFMPWEQWRTTIADVDAEGTGTTLPIVPIAALPKRDACDITNPIHLASGCL